MCLEPRHWVCKPEYLVPVPSQDKVGGWRQEGHLAYKWTDDGGGSLVSPDGVVPSRMVGVSASLIFPCTIKSRRRFLLAPAHPVSPWKRAIKWLCVCVCVKIYVYLQEFCHQNSAFLCVFWTRRKLQRLMYDNCGVWEIACFVICCFVNDCGLLCVDCCDGSDEYSSRVHCVNRCL